MERIDTMADGPLPAVRIDRPAADAAQLAQTQAHAIRTAQEGMWQQLRARGLA